MTGYDGRGARFDITVVEGNDLSFTVTAVGSDAAAVDLSAATIVATVYNGAGTSIDTLTAAVGGAGSNVITLSLTDTEVDALTDPATWALKVTRAGDDRTWLAGRFKVVDADRARNGTSGTALTATVDSNVNVTVEITSIGPSTIGTDVEIAVRNTSGSTITKGTPVYIAGYSVGQELVLVAPADASSTATMPAIGLAAEDIGNNANGAIVSNGRLADIDTSAFTVGNRMYVSETAGQLTATRPTGAAQAQSVGEVVRSNPSNGVLDVALSQTYKTGFAAGLLEDGTAADARATLGVLSTDEVQRVFSIDAYGGVGDGTTDNSTALDDALAAAYAAGGGVVFIPEGVYRVDSQVVVPNDGDATPEQPPIEIRGVGTRWNGNLTSGLIVAGGSVLDLRYSGATAKVVTTGAGTLKLTGVTLADLGTSSTPFVLTTNTTLITDDVVVAGNPSKSAATCDQDAFIIGGTSGTAGAAVTSAFRGWGTTIDGVKFTRIRRGVYGRAACNSVHVTNNVFDVLCGATSSEAAIQFDGTVDQATANVLIGNLIEVQNYVYGVRFTDSSFNVGYANSFWDEGGSFVSCYLDESGSTANTMLGTYGDAEALGIIAMATAAGKARGNWIFGGNNAASSGSPVSVRPAYLPSDPSLSMIDVTRSEQESVDAALQTFIVKYNGSVELKRRNSTNPNVIVNGASGSLTFDYQAIVRSTGDLFIYAGTANDTINAERGLFKDRPLATASRPAASTVGVGACYYDTTLSKPVWSDGTNWRDAAGTAV